MEKRVGAKHLGGKRSGGQKTREPRPAGVAPDAASLREAALLHLSRFAATEAQLAGVLQRRIDRWARRAEAEGQDEDAVVRGREQAHAAIASVIAALRDLGLLNDAEFAASRAKRLTREGRSRRATLAHLAARGIGQETAEEALPEDETRDLAAACAFLRRRRLPPFAEGDRMRALAALARAGYDRDTAEQALDLDPEDAEDRIIALRRGALAG